MYASVVVDIAGKEVPEAFTYAVPPALRPHLTVGSYVRVPLGKREALGYVVEVDTPPPPGEAKEISALVHPQPLFDAPLLSLARWIAHRYHASLGETLRCIVPEGLATRLRHVLSLADGVCPEETARQLGRRSPGLAALVRLLAAEGPLEAHVLRSRWEGRDLAGALARLRQRGWLKEETRLEAPSPRAPGVRVLAPAVPLSDLEAEAEARAKRAPAQARALRLFVERGGHDITAREAALLGASPAALAALVRAGVLREEREVVRPGAGAGVGPGRERPCLTPAQEEAAGVIAEALAARQHDTILLHGVTASGKTEVYLAAIEAALSQGRDAIVLLPEISLTAQVVDVFRSRLGDGVAVLHSRLSSGERYQEWQRLRSAEAHVAVGPRSALFAPCPRPGLIIVDEEHEPSYKQENSPRYHARQAARQRAREADALLVLGSATPSVESYYLATQGEYRLIEMRERVAGRALAAVEVVDLRTRDGSRTGVLSARLKEALAERLARGEQSILFLNRRGFAPFLLCRDCGFIGRCPNCSVALTFHLTNAALRCHHCNHQQPAPTLCPQCAGRDVRPFGLGTQRVESEVLALFPHARVLRMDRDTTATKDAHARLYRAFHTGQADILIGTQMVAKGLDFPRVTLVGVVTADQGLSIPDFRAAERTFQLLTQVAGRAGRGDRPGEVVFQSYNPEH
ncbi:MAG: primosomal protein N', partial [Armatimonadota bacterium]|nr:primosomal protein N' [Armatimonadota bacterium]